MSQRSLSKMGTLAKPKAGKSGDSPSTRMTEPQSAPFVRLYNPSPEEIKQECTQIRQGWSAAERRRRREYVVPAKPRSLSLLRIFCSPGSVG
jgi:hypothetical protein